MTSQPSTTAARAFLIGLVLCVAPFKARNVDAEPTSSSPSSVAERSNVVLITLDTTRADHLGSYGWPHARTPHLDRLAASGVRFTRCDATAPLTLPSHASLMTGLVPPRHGVRDNGTFALAPKMLTVAEQMRASGYDTAAAVSSVVLARRFGLAQGFRVYDDAMIALHADAGAEQRNAASTTAAAVALLPRLETPFFLWTHYYDPHVQYQAPEDVRAQQSGPHADYDAEIAFMDRELGKLLASLPENTIVVVIADHGEMLGDLGESTHGVLPHAGSRRVPLLVAGPGVASGRVEDSLVSSVDVAPTLLELAGAAPLPGVDGRSLVPALVPGGEGSARVSPRITYTEAYFAYYAYRWHPLRALSDGEWLYVDGLRPRLFDLEDDPAEEDDLAARQSRRVDRWRLRLDELRASWGESDLPPESMVISQEDREQLTALGYLGGQGASRPDQLEDLPDPYGLIDLAVEIQEIGALVQRLECEAALPRLVRLLRRSRDNLPALNMAGICHMDQGNYREALPFFEHAVREHPDSALARANLAGCFLQLDRLDDAESAYRDTLRIDPAHAAAVANLARILRNRGDRREALQVLDGAFDTGADEARWHLERGLTRGEMEQLPAALADFQAVLRTQADHREALENAARALWRLGRPEQAVVTYRRLLTLEPERGDLWKTLGAIELFDLGRPEAARAAFAKALVLEKDPAERADLEAMLRDLG